ncbi:MAG TPA: hypothetical protein PKE12_14720 [Kiritimatiellia bacterium]|nr:hypothetical protein [Kiritimatiellia bacterium]
MENQEQSGARDDSHCPSCNAPLGVGAVICLQCGYDTRTGRRAGEAGGRKPSPLIVAGLIVLIAAALAIVFLRASSPTPAPPPVQSAPAIETVSTPVAAEPEPTPESAIEPAAPAPAEAPPAESTEASPATDAVEPEETEPEPPPAPVIDWDAVEATQRERAAMELDRRAPLFEAGEAVELRMANGFVHKGLFRGIDNGFLTLEFATNDIRQLALKEMDRATRLRAEPDYRARYLDYHVQQRIAELRRAQAAAP